MAKLSQEQMRVFDDTLKAMKRFRDVFGDAVSEGLVAEIYAARQLGLTLTDEVNTPGYDAVAADGTRYQVKYRAETTPIVDMNNFDFDYLLLVNLDTDYGLKGMWQITAQEAQEITTYREKFRKYQTTQTKLKRIAERLV